MVVYDQKIKNKKGKEITYKMMKLSGTNTQTTNSKEKRSNQAR